MPKQSMTAKEIINNYGATFAFIIAIIVFSFTSRGFFSGQNLQNILVQSTSLGICAFGLTFVLLTGEIDMSYAGVIGLVGTVLAGMLKDGHAIGMVSLVCLGIGLGTGIVNALLIVVLKLPSFLVTVAVIVLYFEDEGLVDKSTGDDVGWIDAIYFAMVTITTVGYGDIVPVTDQSRMVDVVLLAPIRLIVLFIFLRGLHPDCRSEPATSGDTLPQHTH